MKTVTKLFENVYHIISEPGDITHYDYIAYDDSGTFHFAAAHSALVYPHTLELFDVKHFDRMQVLEVAEVQHTNPYTVAECARTAMEIASGNRVWNSFGLQYKREGFDHEKENGVDLADDYYFHLIRTRATASGKQV